MATSVQDLILAAQTQVPQSPLADLLKSAAGGFFEGYNQRYDTAYKLAQIAEKNANAAFDQARIKTMADDEERKREDYLRKKERRKLFEDKVSKQGRSVKVKVSDTGDIEEEYFFNDPTEKPKQYDRAEYYDETVKAKKVGRWNPVAGKVERSPDDPLAEPPKSVSAAETFKLYQTARDGLISGLKGTETGYFAGRLPAITESQQVAEGAVAAMAPVLKQLFRVAGEGVFTDKDQELLLNMLPKRTTSQGAIKKKMENIDAIVKAKLGLSTDDVREIIYNSLIEEGKTEEEAFRILQEGGY